MVGGKKTIRGIIGLDIGGTKIDAVFWRGGRVFWSTTVATPTGSRRFFSTIFELIDQMRAQGEIKGIGIGLAGSVDWRSGKVLSAAQFRFLRGMSLKNQLQKRFHVPVRLDNDTNCFLLAEKRYGVARGKRHVVALTLGTGVGGAALVDGRLLRGVHGAAGELGHTVVHDGLTVEDLVSGRGFRRLGFADPRDADRAAYLPIGKFLGIALANVTNTFDPELIILGGGIARSHRQFLPIARREGGRHVLRALGRRLPPVRVSRLRQAGAIGAASLLLM